MWRQTALYSDTPRQYYKSNQAYYNHQRSDKKGVYQIDITSMEDQQKDFHTIFNLEEEELAYLNKRFDEVFVNFVGIEAIYSKCHLSFPLKF